MIKSLKCPVHFNLINMKYCNIINNCNWGRFRVVIIKLYFKFSGLFLSCHLITPNSPETIKYFSTISKIHNLGQSQLYKNTFLRISVPGRIKRSYIIGHNFASLLTARNLLVVFYFVVIKYQNTRPSEYYWVTPTPYQIAEPCNCQIVSEQKIW